MKAERKTYPVHHYRFWAAFAIHMRPYLLFVSGAGGFAGMALAARSNPLHLTTGWLGFAAFFFAYGFGQALTDCFQTDTDRLSAPYRPLSQGIVSPWPVGIVALSGLLVLGLILIGLNIHNLGLCTISIFGLATYSVVKRKYWWGGPFYNAWIVALLPAMGVLSITRAGFGVLFRPEVYQLVLLSFFAYANFVLIGYLKDITPDRKTGYRTFPVVFGWNATVWVGDLLVAISIFLVYKLVDTDPAGLAVATLGALIALAGQLYGHLTPNKTESNAAFPVAATVRSFILWHLAVIVASHRPLLLFAIAYYLLFELVLRARPMREQI